MSLLTHRAISTILTLCACFLGTWSIWNLILVLNGASFADLRTQLAGIVLLGLALFFWLRPGGDEQLSRHHAEDAVRVETASPGNAITACTPLLFVAILGLLLAGAHSVAWMMAMLVLTTAVLRPDAFRQSLQLRPVFPPSWLGHWPTLLSTLISLFVVLMVARPNRDDARYLAIVSGHLSAPEAPLMRFEPMYGQPFFDHGVLWESLTSYELLAASLSSLLGMDPFTVYYLILPAFFSLLALCALYALAMQFYPRAANLILLVATMLALLLGEGERSTGSFGLIRLFQGKAAFAYAIVPMVMYFAICFSQRPGLRSWMLLTLSASTATLFTSSALIITPLLIAMTLLSCFLNRECGWGTLAAGAGSLLAPAGKLLCGHLLVDRLRFDSERLPASYFADQWTVFASVQGQLLWFLLCTAGFLFLCDNDRRLRRAGIYVFLAMLILLNGHTVQAVSALIIETIGWRLLWAIPVALLISIAVPRAMGILWSGSGIQGWPVRGTAALFLAVCLALPFSGRSVFSEEYGTFLAPLAPKVYPEDLVAAELMMQLVDTESTILGPKEVTSVLSGHLDHPRLWVVRPEHLRWLHRYYGDRGYSVRAVMNNYVNGIDSHNDLAPEFLALAIRVLNAAQPDWIILKQTTSALLPDEFHIRSLGYHMLGRSDRYEIWKRQPASTASP